MESEEKKVKFRSGVVVATLKRKGDNARVSFTRTYCNKAGKVEHTKALRLGDLPRAQLALQKVFDHLLFEESK